MIRIVLILAVAVTLISCRNDSEKKPNVIIILVDDLGWTDLGCYGTDFYRTPNIDLLASDGVRFTNSYSSCTVCSPTRASIMTGKYPARLHLTDWIEGHIYPWAKLKVPDWKMYLDSAEYTLAEAFGDNGYFTAHVGKWHLGGREGDWPEHHGFALNLGGWAKGSPNKNPEEGSFGYFSPYGNPRLDDGPEGEYLTQRLADEVCNIIDKKADVPFFINFCLYNVHTPLQAAEEKISKYKALADTAGNHNNPVYAAMIEHTDEAVGQVIAKLKEKNLYDNTIILFSSDNGGLIGKGKQKVTNNTPLRDGKGSMFEGGVRIPTILYIPGLHSELREIHEPVISMDYYPTLLELAGIKLPRKHNEQIDGLSWVPLLEGKNNLDRDALYWHYPHYHSEGAVPYSAVRSGDWKLIENLESGVVMLYNLENDIGEVHNLAGEEPEKVEMLKRKLDQWRMDVKAQFPVENENFDAKRQRQK